MKWTMAGYVLAAFACVACEAQKIRECNAVIATVREPTAQIERLSYATPRASVNVPAHAEDVANAYEHLARAVVNPSVETPRLAGLLGQYRVECLNAAKAARKYRTGVIDADPEAIREALADAQSAQNRASQLRNEINAVCDKHP